MSQTPNDQNASAIDQLAIMNDQLHIQTEQLRIIVQIQDSQLEAYRRSVMTKKPLWTIFVSVALGVFASQVAIDIIYWLFAPQIVEAAMWRFTNGFQ